jgi:hypothetical protein
MNKMKAFISRGAAVSFLLLVLTSVYAQEPDEQPLLANMALPAAEKKELKGFYEKKFLVVLRDGLAVGICEHTPYNPARHRYLYTGSPLPVRITGDQAEYHTQAGARAKFDIACGKIIPQPLHTGEVLWVRHVSLHGEELRINVEAIFRRDVAPGRKAQDEYEKYWVEDADFRFVGKADAPDATAALVEKWVKVFDTPDVAAKFGNTISEARSK